MPTAEDLRQMPPAKRERVRRAIWKIISETDDYAARRLEELADRRSWAEAVREEARRLEAMTPRDHVDVIERRRQIALQATR
jgi:hypothetical protein